MRRRDFVLRSATATLAATAGALPVAWAQGAPNKVFVGFPPGGLPDSVARIVSPVQGQVLEGPVVVENRPGANGRLAAQAVKAATPDGRTLLVCPASAMVHLPHVYKDLGYDPFADFAPVAQIVENAFGFAIGAQLGPRNMAEWVSWCKQNPDKASFGSPGQGSSPHFMGVTMARALGITMQHIPYRGSNFALTDVSGGHILGMMSTTGQILPFHRNGQLRLLATTARARLPELPDVPTFTELGVPQLTLTEGTYVLAPAKTPAAVIDKLSAAIVAALAKPEVITALKGQADLAPLNAAGLATRLREDFDRRGAGIRAAGFSASQG